MGNLTDNYHILKELGRGGMGAVYLANDKRLDRKVAIKILQIAGNFTIEQKSEIIARFQKEAKAIAKLSHPNIVNIYDVGEEDGQYYMVMEFLEGRSIGGVLEAEKSLPIEECVAISIQICKALDYMHKNSIVHRDIKPDNIIVGSDKMAKITDFGIAQNDSDQMRLTQDGAILGSVMYISPEQLRNSKDVDNRADIFSYGVTLYQMLTGKLPFDGDTIGEVVSKVLGENPELPRKINPSIPYELEAIVMKAMSKDREKRYKNIEDMERDLQNLSATHSFKKSIIAATSSNLDQNTNSSNVTSKTIYNNQSTSNNIKSSAIIIEKASSQEKIIRTLIKLVTAIVLIHISYSFLTSMLESSTAYEIFSAKINNAMIQGPYSQSLVAKAVSIKSAIYSLVIVMVMLIFSAFSFPIDSKGVHRNFSLSSELLPALLVLILSAAYTFGFVAKTDTNKAYINAYQDDSKSEIANLEYILNQKGLINYSATDTYKKKYRSILDTQKERQGRYDVPEKQLRNVITAGDHINLKIISENSQLDPSMQIADDLINNIFTLTDPAKELFESKTNQLVNVVSAGRLPVLPQTAKYSVIKDPATNKITSVLFEWETDSFEISQGKLKLKHKTNSYEYPQVTQKNVDFKVINSTDKNLFALIYSGQGDLKEKFQVEPNKEGIFSLKEKTEYQVIVVPSEKTALPLTANFSANEKDKVIIDKLFYQKPDYYTLSEKVFSSKSATDIKKLQLKEDNIFSTDDADIVNFNLSSIK